MWEKRYNLLEPHRTGTNIRKYNDVQLRKLINVTTLLDKGMKISHIACLNARELENKTEIAMQAATASESSLLYIDQFVKSMSDMDEEMFEKLFSSCVLRFGLKDTFVEIIYPFLKKVGVMWCCDQILPAHEHFITSLIKQKLFTAADGRHPVKNDPDSWLLALPHGEYHELGLLLGHFLIRNSGHRSIYLGPDVPFVNILPSVEFTKAKNLLISMIRKNDSDQMDLYLNQLSTHIKNCKIYVAVSPGQIDESKFPKIHFLHDIHELDPYLF